MPSEQALKGIKGVDFGWVGVGPLAMKYLSDHGATIIRVESHSKPDPLRLSRPYKDNIPGMDRSGWYANSNSSKLSITLDLNKSRAREVVTRLIKWADVMSVGYTGRALKTMGLEYEMVSQINPQIIYFSTSMQGLTGPHAQYRGFGGEAAALAGFHYICGWPDRAPTSVYGAYTDYIDQRFGAAYILAALDLSRKTGRGVKLEQSQLECAIQFLAPLVMDYQLNGNVACRNGNRLSFAAPHGIYPCKDPDSWCALTVFSDEEWMSFKKTINQPVWVKEPRFATLVGRKENEDELDSLIADWTLLHTASEVMHLMQQAGISAGVVQSAAELLEDPQLEHRKHFRRLNHEVMGIHVYDGPAFILSKTPDSQTAAPCLGTHNWHVYKEILDFSDEEISDFFAEGVITTD